MFFTSVAQWKATGSNIIKHIRSYINIYSTGSKILYQRLRSNTIEMKTAQFEQIKTYIKKLLSNTTEIKICD